MRRLRGELLDLPGFVGTRLHNVGESLFAQGSETEHIRQVEQEIAHLTHPTIYIHVPFCRTQCDFCDFPTVIFTAYLGQKYIAALDHQLAHLQQRYPNLDMSKVYIGGGTPATVLPGLLALAKKYDLGVSELSVEAHPQDFARMTEEELTDLSQTVSRVSIGVQTFDADLLEKMNRNNGHRPLDSIQKAVEAGLLVNADLIYGIDGQTLEIFTQDLEALIAVGVPQITCYPLMGKHTENKPATQEQFYRAMLVTFKNHGYRPLTPWCFTNSDTQGQGEYISQNDNDSREQIIALGIGGISKIRNVFTINHFHLGDYFQAVAKDELPIMSTQKLSTIQEAQYFLLTALFGMQIDTNKLTGDFVTDTLIQTELRALHAIGVVKKSTANQNVYELTEQGMFFMSKAMSSFYAGLGKFRRPHNASILDNEDPHEGAELFAMPTRA